MSNVFMIAELHLNDGEATYDDLRKWVEATSHIDASEKVGVEWDQGYQEIIGLKEYV